MRTGHAHCLLCLNYSHGRSHRFDGYVRINSWSRHLNLPHRLPVQSVVQALDTRLCVWAPALLRPQLQTGQTWTHPSSVVPSYASGFFVSPGPLLSPLTGLSASQTDCRSFTSCQGESTAARWRAGQSLCATPAQVRWVQAIHGGPWWVISCLHAASVEFIAVNRDSSPLSIRPWLWIGHLKHNSWTLFDNNSLYSLKCYSFAEKPLWTTTL